MTFLDNFNATKVQNDLLMAYLINKTKQGQSITSALEIFAEDQKSSSKKYYLKLRKIINDIRRGKDDLEYILFRYKIIDRFQLTIIKSSKEKIDGMQVARTLSKEGSGLYGVVLKNIGTPLLALIGILIGLHMYIPGMEKEIAELTELNAQARDFIKVPPYFNHQFTTISISISVFLFIAIIGGYTYLNKFKTLLLYKFLPLQAYSDGRFIFKIMANLLKNSIPMYNVCTMLSKEYHLKSVRDMFYRISQNIKKHRKYYTVYEKSHFPKLVVGEIRMAELSRINMHMAFDDLSETCGLMYERKLEGFISYSKIIFWGTAIMAIVLISNDILLVISSEFTFKSMYS